MHDWIDALDEVDVSVQERAQDLEEPHRGPEEAPFSSLQQISKGDTVRLLGDGTALYAACWKLACLGPEECDRLAGTSVRVLALDESDDSVKVRVPHRGDVWFTVGSLVPDGAGASRAEDKEAAAALSCADGFFFVPDGRSTQPVQPPKAEKKAPSRFAKVPLESVDQIRGDELSLMADGLALYNACWRVACLQKQDCMNIAGATVRVLEVDGSDDTVKVFIRDKGEIWFPIHSFVQRPGEVVEEEPEPVQEPPLEPEPVAPTPEPAPMRKKGIFARFAETAELLGAVSGPSAADEEAAERARAKEALEREQEARREAEEAQRREAAELRWWEQVQVGKMANGEYPSSRPCLSYPLGKRVRVMQAIVMRSEEDVGSAEVAKLLKNQELRVLEHGSEPAGRRLRAKDMDTGHRGWVSCATKSNKPLLELLSGIAIPVCELDVPMSTALVVMPSLEEVLAKVDADEFPERRQEVDRGPRAIMDKQEAEAEAMCVWQSFTDMAAVEEVHEEDPQELDPRCMHARAREQKMFAGELDAMVVPAEDMVVHAQDQLVKQLARDREAKAARKRLMQEKLKNALAGNAKGLMPKTLGIGRSEASSSQVGASTQASLQSVQELRWTLEEERAAGPEEEQPQVSQAALPWVSRRAAAPRQAPSAMPIGGGSGGSVPSRSGKASKPATVIGAVESLAADGAFEAASDPRATAAAALEKGMVVQIHGLQTTAELNGLYGECQQWDPEGRRWIVRFDNGKCKKFRPQNLMPCTDRIGVPSDPTVAGKVGAPSNGEKGSLPETYTGQESGDYWAHLGLAPR